MTHSICQIHEVYAYTRLLVCSAHLCLSLALSGRTLSQMPARPCVLNAGCPSRVILARIGDKWTALVIRCLAGRTLRYNELQREVAGISQKMLTQTVRALEDDGILLRKVYPVIPPMVEYSLTPLGRTLVLPVHAICDWAENHLPRIEAHRRERRRACLPKRAG
jgi:DNA-binding HxlR family transcriptional regulator